MAHQSPHLIVSEELGTPLPPKLRRAHKSPKEPSL